MPKVLEAAAQQQGTPDTGTSVPRVDLPAKLFGTFQYATSVRVDGMPHGRVVRPSGAGATLARVDDGAAKAIPGFVKTVVEKNFVGVVAGSEWSAIRAARALEVTWNAPSAPFPEQRELYHKRTGAVRVARFTCFHDCGLMVNPDAVRGTVLANLIQSMSRSLIEELRFDRNTVTRVDWATYPIARSTDIPADIEVVLLNRPELPPGGVGEPATRPTAAAIANAIFDATGARIRRAPFTPARVKEALSPP